MGTYRERFETAMFAVYKIEKASRTADFLAGMGVSLIEPQASNTTVPIDPAAAWRAVKRKGNGNCSVNH